MAKKGIEGGEDIDNIPEAMRQLLAMQALESGKHIGANFLNRGSFGPMMVGDQNPQGKVGEYLTLSRESVSCLQMQLSII
jgi:hypothetical protein